MIVSNDDGGEGVVRTFEAYALAQVVDLGGGKPGPGVVGW